MPVGVNLPSGDTGNAQNLVDELLVHTRQAADAGLSSVWFSQMPVQYDATTMAALAGAAVPGIEVGTSVVPIYARHPLVLASLAQTAQAAAHGRFTLGLGLGAVRSLGPVYGVPYPPPIAHLRECLTVLRGVFSGEVFDFTGKTISAHLTATAGLPGEAWVPGGSGVPILVAAMGPQALRAAGELADGTVPFLAGPRTLSTRIVPAITRAAESAGRPAPRVVVMLPAVVTDDVDDVRAVAAGQLAFYGQVPSYQQVMADEGVTHPVELGVFGDEKEVATGVQRYLDAGATDVVVTMAGMRSTADRLRTWALLGTL
jgi:F420-dependent oxidoreductase-like protein